jgi:phosphohistidine phosphatase
MGVRGGARRGAAAQFSSLGQNRAAMTDAKRLLLLRHAKSSWDDPALADHDRPLAARGRKAAQLIGAYLRRERIPVSLVLCSSARRARETLELVDPSGELQIEPELYGASREQLHERVRQLPEASDSVMLIGHNPAIQELAASLAGDDGELTEQKFPTGALAVLTFGGPWRALRTGDAKLAAFVKPRELSG